jgi:hypothetical protein
VEELMEVTSQWTLRSPEIDKLVEALAKAQTSIKAPNKGRTASIEGKASYSYSYADLADVIACYREPLAKEGLAVAQTFRPQDGHLILLTTLMHLSGQWVGSEFPIKVSDRPQETGSAITYARRYCASAIIGIAAEDDDDGQAAQNASRQEPVSSEAAAVLMLAAELSELTDKPAEEHIKAASTFTNKQGKLVEGFTDPRKVRPGKWLSMTRANLAKMRHNAQMAAEPGAEEGAAALT